MENRSVIPTCIALLNRFSRGHPARILLLGFSARRWRGLYLQGTCEIRFAIRARRVAFSAERRRQLLMRGRVRRIGLDCGLKLSDRAVEIAGTHHLGS